jgi:hypothetical protein
MSKDDAHVVKYLLERANEAAKPLKDPGLTKKIQEAAKHVTEKIDPTKGG